MNAIAVRLVAIAALVLAIAGGLLYVKTLRAELAEAQGAASTAQALVGQRDATIAQLEQNARDQAAQLAQLETKRRQVAASLSARQTELDTLKRQNEKVRAWADSPLPDDVASMYASPDITGADGYIADMLTGSPVRPASATPAR
ncbi:hypothetical protein [Paraburkholderia lycopersici]|uniref:Phage lysis regulatory protein, LysB family n=1 Tax=Paraburkholderia lycopersici TaxID=416944 RepID=A0A1G7CQR0_9BURK|nr:hypothetical protein [Paraburkholderia lycopersici]SDE41573.1 phage lysis regulatory protein, LysB family [Paraburkholderia lycopersici]